ncbi:MAG: hypothetical protein RIR41_2442 [Pseudomonadota bacterium]|jgi:hypothetical protein
MADAAGKLPIIACVRDAWLFLRDHWRMFVPAAIATALVSQVGFILAVMSGGGAGSQPAFGGNVGDLAVATPAVLASLVFAAAVLRKAVRNEFTGPMGLGFGADELRLLAIVAAYACMIIPLGTLVFVIVTTTVLSRLAATPDELAVLLEDPEALNAALTQALGPSGTAAFLLFIMLVFAAAIYLFTRLFMVNAATIGERRVVMFQTWSWSRGNVLRMFAAMMLTWFPAYVIDSLVVEVGVAILRPIASEGNAGIVLIAFNAVATFVAAIVGIPSIVLGAILCKGLRPADFVAK